MLPPTYWKPDTPAHTTTHTHTLCCIIRVDSTGGESIAGRPSNWSRVSSFDTVFCSSPFNQVSVFRSLVQVRSFPSHSSLPFCCCWAGSYCCCCCCCVPINLPLHLFFTIIIVSYPFISPTGNRYSLPLSLSLSLSLHTSLIFHSLFFFFPNCYFASTHCALIMDLFGEFPTTFS